MEAVLAPLLNGAPDGPKALPMVRKFGKFCSGAKVRKSCRPQKSLQHEHLLAKVGFDIAENESFYEPSTCSKFLEKSLRSDIYLSHLPDLKSVSASLRGLREVREERPLTCEAALGRAKIAF